MKSADPNCPLTDADCDCFIRMIQNECPDFEARLEKLARAGFNLEQLRQDNKANMEFARGIIREYFPTRAPYTQVG